MPVVVFDRPTALNQKLISEIGKSQRLRIVNTLKRTQGLSVNELSEKLGMSYMGIKQHCVELQKNGYLVTWRRPKKIGRPELAYRLTRQAHELFPTASNGVTIALLAAARQFYGPAAPEKLLFRVFQDYAAAYAKKVRGDSPVERLKWLARVRDAEGCMAEFQETGAGARLVEFHSPILDLLEHYPIAARLETDTLQQAIGGTLRREEATASGLYCCIHWLT